MKVVVVHVLSIINEDLIFDQLFETVTFKNQATMRDDNSYHTAREADLEEQ